MKVVSYEDLFGSNNIVAYCEDKAIVKDGKEVLFRRCARYNVF